LEANEGELKLIAIPPGVAHTYTVLGDEPMGMLYHAGQAYDPKNPGIEEFPYDEK
jgi:dTDP-4-dehydrorhamnose 3,5-epimerase-like enzyme